MVDDENKSKKLCNGGNPSVIYAFIDYIGFVWKRCFKIKKTFEYGNLSSYDYE